MIRLLPTCFLLTCALGGTAAAFADGDLVDIVPASTSAMWHKVGDAETEPLESRLERVLDAVLAARLDELGVQALGTAGVDPAVLEHVRSVRNVLLSLAGMVPWRELMRREFVWAETTTPFIAGWDTPSAVFASRPPERELRTLKSSLAGLMGSISAMTATLVRYDIQTRPAPSGPAVVVHTLSVPAFGDAQLVQMAVRDDVLLVGLGQEYFEETLKLLSGEDGSRLSTTPRFRAAFRGLPADAHGRRYVNVRLARAAGVDLVPLLGGLELNGGMWQGFLNDTLELSQDVDTLATTIQCRGDRVFAETMTRFDPEGHPMRRTGLATPAAAELFHFVPSNAVSFAMRGQIDLHPIFAGARELVHREGAWGDMALWAGGVVQAAMDLSVEEDLLSWLGSEHITIEVPGAAGQTDQVMLCRVRDAAAARKCLTRLEAVYQAAIPPILANVQAGLSQLNNSSIPVPRAEIVDSDSVYPGLRRLELSLGPIPVPNLTFGTVGNVLVMTTSTRAFEECMAVAAGEADGLEMHPLGVELLGRSDFATARLQPMDRPVREMAQTAAALTGMTQTVLSMVAAQGEGANQLLELVSNFQTSMLDILETVDFLGEALTTSELRDGGFAHYERTVVQLRGMPTVERMPNAVTSR